MDLTLPILTVIGYVAYTFSEKEIRERRELRKKKSSTVGDNVYSSNDVRKNNNYVQKLADDRYTKSKNTKETKIVPNFFNNSCQIIDCAAEPLKERKKLSDFPPPKKENFSMLAGGKVDVSRHNNMQPFFRGSSVGNTKNSEDADLIGLYTGNQRTYRTKEEPVAFFKPSKQEIFPTENFNKDESRYIGSIYKTSEVPVEQQRVRRINEADLRPVYKNIDQLNIDPKQTYKGVFKTGQIASVRGYAGEMVKNRPETFVENSPSRYFVDGPSKKQRVTISKEQASGVTGIFGEDSRNTDKTFGVRNLVPRETRSDFNDAERVNVDPTIKDSLLCGHTGNAVSGIKKSVNNTTEGMRQACRVEIENYINSAGTSTLHYSRPENVISKDTKEIYSDLNDYTFKKAAGAPAALPQNGNTVQKFRDDNNKTKFNGLRFSKISENPTDKEYSGKATRKTHEKPENTRFLQDVQSLPKNDLIKRYA